MPYTHHTHSSTFCQHATSPLPTLLTHAQSLHYRTLALTEHMPRTSAHDLYPEELTTRTTPLDLARTFDTYHDTAHALRASLPPTSPLTLLIGFETESIRAGDHARIRALLHSPRYRWDFCVGSVHHVRESPIDFDREMWETAAARCGGVEACVKEYLRAVAGLAREVAPAVVGHFDLVRLKSREPRRLLREYGGEVWGLVEEALEVIKGYGGCLEVSSAAVRKGWRDPYPGRDVMERWREMGGRVVMSDDAHDVAHLGKGYGRVLGYLKELGWTEVAVLGRGGVVRMVPLEEVEREEFWRVSGERAVDADGKEI